MDAQVLDDANSQKKLIAAFNHATDTHLSGPGIYHLETEILPGECGE